MKRLRIERKSGRTRVFDLDTGDYLPIRSVAFEDSVDGVPLLALELLVDDRRVSVEAEIEAEVAAEVEADEVVEDDSGDEAAETLVRPTIKARDLDDE